VATAAKASIAQRTNKLHFNSETQRYWTWTNVRTHWRRYLLRQWGWTHNLLFTPGCSWHVLWINVC